MQLKDLDQPVEMHLIDQQAASGFQIAMNAKAFRVLSSTIYQDKIGSIVRELSANAMDAHVMAGVDRPFRIHFPDQFEPHFEVQDYGTGIAPDKIHSVFTVYFNSTKDQSNDVIGAFGLGSKTPFSYTDQFTVTNRYNGKQYIYSAFVAGDGQPSLVLLDESDTAECNGLCISMSVKSEDYTKFSEAAKTQLRFLKTQPLYENAPYGFAVVDPFEGAKVLAQASGFTLIASTHAQAFVIQGQIGYVLDVHKLDYQSHATKFLKHLMGFGSVKIEFNIGEIGVTASREAVEYTPETIKVIQDKIAAIQSDLIQSYQKRIQQHTTNWDIAAEANSGDMFSIGSGFSSYFNSGSSHPKRLSANWQFELPTGAHAIIKTYYAKRSEGNRYVCPTEGLKVYIQTPDCTYKQKRATEIFSSVKQGEAVVLIKFDKDQTSVEKIKEALGGITSLQLLSDVKVEVTPRSRAIGVRSTAWVINRNDINTVKNWDRVTVDLETLIDNECIVFPVEAYREVSPKVRSLLENLRNCEWALGGTSTKIYAVRDKDYQEALDLGAEPLEDYVKKFVDKAKEAVKASRKTSQYRTLVKEAEWFEDKITNNGLALEDFPKDVQKSLKLLRKIEDNWRHSQKIKIRNEYYLGLYFPDSTTTEYHPVFKSVVEKLKEYKENTPIFKLSSYNLSTFSTKELKMLMQVNLKKGTEDGNEQW